MVCRITSTQLSARHENYTENNLLTDVKDKRTEIVEQVLGLEQSRNKLLHTGVVVTSWSCFVCAYSKCLFTVRYCQR